MVKKIFMTEEELRDMEINICNDYIGGTIVSVRYINYLDEYEMVVKFDSKGELKVFCNRYGYKTSRVGNRDVLVKIDEA